MNRKEAARVLEIRQHLWPHTPNAQDPAGEVDTWADFLSHRSAEQVMAVMRALQAREFAPTLGQINEALDPQPEASGVFLAFKAALELGFSPLYTPPAEIPWGHPAIAAAAEAGLWKEFGLSPDPTYDEYAQANAANWRKAFERDVQAVIGKYRSERIAELTGGKPAQLEAEPREHRIDGRVHHTSFPVEPPVVHGFEADTVVVDEAP